MSRQLIQQSAPGIEQLVREDLSFLIAKQIDRALIYGGGANEPSGIIANIGSGVQTGTLATPDWQAVLEMLEQVELENASAFNWLTNPTGKKILASTLKEAGLPGYLLESGRMADLPLFSTNQIETDTNGSPLILGDWSQVLLGIWSEIDILVNPYAEPAYTRGGVQVRAMATCDIALRHPQAFVVATDLAV
jgi:HK97 family phage major capsid protein